MAIEKVLRLTNKYCTCVFGFKEKCLQIKREKKRKKGEWTKGWEKRDHGTI